MFFYSYVAHVDTYQQGSAKNVPARWIWIKKINSWNSTWSNMFCSGSGSSQVDPIFIFWILIKSSWSNIFCTGFGSSLVDPIFSFWILIKSSWSNIFCSGLDLNQVELIQFLFFGFFSSGTIFFAVLEFGTFLLARLRPPCGAPALH